MVTKINTPRQLEHIEQVSLFKFLKTIENRWPEIKNIYAIPNSARRNVQTAAYMKAEGMKAGIPDICVPVRHVTEPFGALYIEMKAPGDKLLKLRKGQIKAHQREMMDRLRACGNKVIVCYTWKDAATEIIEYLGIPPTAVKIQ